MESDRTEALVADMAALGVYDLVFGGPKGLRPEEVERRIRQPASFADVVAALGRERPPGSRLLQVVRRARPREQEESAVEKSGGTIQAVREEAGREPLQPVKQVAPEPERVSKDAAGLGAGLRKLLRVLPAVSPVQPADVEEGLEGISKPPRPLIAVWSPVSSGKTFVAVNLAGALSLSARTCLVDLAGGAVHTWLCLPEGENSLARVMGGSLLEEVAEGIKITSRLVVYTSDPALPPVRVGLGRLGRFFSSPQVEADVFVLDLPSELGGWGEELLKISHVILVADPDYAHVMALKGAAERLKAGGILFEVVMNRYAEPTGSQVAAFWSPEESLGVRPVVLIPCLPGEVYGSILAGRMATELSPELDRAFRALVRAHQPPESDAAKLSLEKEVVEIAEFP